MIVDDEPLAQQRLSRMIDQLEGYRLAAVADNGVEALRIVRDQQPDILLLDIHMPGLDGLQVAEQLSQLDVPPAVVFCTAYDQYAIDAFDVQAAGYLLKPIRKSALLNALQRSQKPNRLQLDQQPAAERQSTGNHRKHIAVKNHKGLTLIPLEQIYSFVADQKYVVVHYRHGEALIEDSLKKLEHEFADRFIRVHRNALVAVDVIEALEKTAGGYQLQLKGAAEKIPVSRRHLVTVRKRIRQL